MKVERIIIDISVPDGSAKLYGRKLKVLVDTHMSSKRIPYRVEQYRKDSPNTRIGEVMEWPPKW
jgi:hypothetical protein